jgi:hypothetical protein
MASVVFDKQDIHPFIEHHIALLERLNLQDESPFALIYFSLRDRPKVDYAKMLQKILRKTDALFQDNTDFVVILCGTDWNGATEVLAGIQEFLGQPTHDTIVTYPEDGEEAKKLMRALFVKVDETQNSEVGMLKLHQ